MAERSRLRGLGLGIPDAGRDQLVTTIESIQGNVLTVRNFSMLGHMGFDERDKAGLMRTLGGTAVWGFSFKKCMAMWIDGTERVPVAGSCLIPQRDRWGIGLA